MLLVCQAHQHYADERYCPYEFQNAVDVVHTLLRVDHYRYECFKSLYLVEPLYCLNLFLVQCVQPFLCPLCLLLCNERIQRRIAGVVGRTIAKPWLHGRVEVNLQFAHTLR